MNRHQFLRRLHEVYRPRTYLEIGVRGGKSLALSRVPTVAVDPAFSLTSGLRCDLHLIHATSDDFFARDDPFEHFSGTIVDLAFIDGMHLLEYVLRDFINTEKYSTWSSLIVLDDLLPRNVEEAARVRNTGGWTGDVYKIIPVLQRYRPDLRLALLDTRPTGILTIFGSDPTSTVLTERYDEIVDTFLVKDPQQVPDELLSRSCTMDPDALLRAPFWSSLVSARTARDGSYGRAELLSEVDATLGHAPRPELSNWTPSPTATRDSELDPSACVDRYLMSR